MKLTGLRSKIVPNQPNQPKSGAVDRLQILTQAEPGTLVVNEIYRSLQGESSRAGLPCTFVRLSGCPLRCRWCDTGYAFNAGQPMPMESIIERVQHHDTKLVEVTGGEPLAQPGVHQLLSQLCDLGHEVLLETSGAIDITPVDPRVIIILDLKCPGSNEVSSNDLGNLERLRTSTELKFVISDKADFDWAVELIRTHQLERQQVHFSPVFGELAPRDLADWLLASRLNARLQLQQHKQIWPVNTRGV